MTKFDNLYGGGRGLPRRFSKSQVEVFRGPRATDRRRCGGHNIIAGCRSALQCPRADGIRAVRGACDAQFDTATTVLTFQHFGMLNVRTMNYLGEPPIVIGPLYQAKTIKVCIPSFVGGAVSGPVACCGRCKMLGHPNRAGAQRDQVHVGCGRAPLWPYRVEWTRAMD
jgi:hypothetical protein